MIAELCENVPEQNIIYVESDDYTGWLCLIGEDIYEVTSYKGALNLVLGLL